LISLYPINPQNRPANEFEQNGLESVEVHPIRPYIQITKVGRKKYFQAIYPDIAVTRGCVNCHNGHPQSPKKDFALDDVMAITGQRPVITKARKSIATFKLREGRSIGIKVTLRGERMWAFLDRLINVALPRTRDFRGVSPKSFDGRGNYTMGLREQLIFPEIRYDKTDKARGMEITVVTSAQTDEEGRELLRLMGMPFRDR